MDPLGQDVVLNQLEVLGEQGGVGRADDRDGHVTVPGGRGELAPAAALLLLLAS